jgi:hypothetical protein
MLLAVIGCVVGCSSKGSDPADLPARRLGQLGLWYAMCVGQNKGKPPKSADQVKAFGARRITSEELAAFGVANIDELFVSPRDGLPYKLVEYKRLPPPSGDPVVVFYEHTSQNGIRRAALLGGGSLECDDATLARLVPTFKP